MNPWLILNISPTNDKREIKRSYIRLLKACHPEDDEKGFMELREAYEYALLLSDTIEDEYCDSKSIESELIEDGDGHETEDISKTDSLLPEHIENFFLSQANFSDLKNHDNNLQNENVNLNLNEEYQVCLNLLDEILSQKQSSQELKSWKKLFESPILLNYQYRLNFCEDLIEKIQQYLIDSGAKNSLTPEIIILIDEYINQSILYDQYNIISDINIIKISHLADTASEMLNYNQHKVKTNINWLFWLLFSPFGRIDISTFWSVFFIIYIFPYIIIGLLPSAIANSSQNIIDQSNIEKVETNRVLKRSEQYKENIFGDISFDSLKEENEILEPTKPVDYQITESLREKAKEKIKNKLDTEPIQPDMEQKNTNVNKINQAYNPEFSKDSMIFLSRKAKDTVLICSLMLYAWILIALIIKRLHDSGRSGTTFFILLLPYIGILILLFLLSSKSEKQDNYYGKYQSNNIKNLALFRRYVFETIAA